MFNRNGGPVCDSDPKNVSLTQNKTDETAAFTLASPATQLKRFRPGSYTRWEGTGINVEDAHLIVHSMEFTHMVCDWEIRETPGGMGNTKTYEGGVLRVGSRQHATSLGVHHSLFYNITGAYTGGAIYSDGSDTTLNISFTAFVGLRAFHSDQKLDQRMQWEAGAAAAACSGGPHCGAHGTGGAIEAKAVWQCQTWNNRTGEYKTAGYKRATCPCSKYAMSLQCRSSSMVILITDSYFGNNIGGLAGGAIKVHDVDMNIVNVVFDNNSLAQRMANVVPGPSKRVVVSAAPALNFSIAAL